MGEVTYYHIIYSVWNWTKSQMFFDGKHGLKNFSKMTTPKSVSLVQNSLKFLPLISNYMSCPLVRLIDIYIQLGHLNP